MFVCNIKNYILSVFVFIAAANLSPVRAADELSLPDQKAMIFRSAYLSNYESILPGCHDNLERILKGISAARFDASVHDLDGFVGKELGNLLDIARSLELGVNLPLDQALIVAHTIHSPQFVAENYVDTLCSGFNAQDLELFSRVVTLAQELLDTWEIDVGISWFATIEDNQTTGGGCLPGRRNRLFKTFAAMMANIGV
jgi:hypothetical protein